MKNSLKRAAVFCLSAGLILTSLTGCSKKKDSFDTAAAAITVNGDSVSAGVLNFAVRYQQASLESLYMNFGAEDPFSQDLFGTGSTLGEQAKASLAEEMTHALLAEQHMADYDVSLSDAEKGAIKDAAAQFIADNDEEVLKELNATQEIVERYLELSLIQSKMEPQMSADVDTEVSDEEAAQRKVQYVLFSPVSAEEAETEMVEEETEITAAEAAAAAAETEEETQPTVETEAETEKVTEKATEAETEKATEKVTEAETEKATEKATEVETETETEAETKKASLTKTTTKKTNSAEETELTTEAAEVETEDPETVAARERAYARAQKMIARVQAGEDFAVVAEDMGQAANERTFGSDYAIAEMVAATDGLADGTLVEEPILASSGGYYVVYLETQLDRDATEAKKEEIVEQRKQDAVEALYTEWEEAGEVKVDSEVLAKITFNYHLEQPAAEEAPVVEETEGMTE